MGVPRGAVVVEDGRHNGEDDGGGRTEPQRLLFAGLRHCEVAEDLPNGLAGGTQHLRRHEKQCYSYGALPS